MNTINLQQALLDGKTTECWVMQITPHFKELIQNDPNFFHLKTNEKFTFADGVPIGDIICRLGDIIFISERQNAQQEIIFDEFIDIK